MTFSTKPKRKILPTNRAMLVEKDGRRYTPTFCRDDMGWRCWYRAKLHWLRGLTPEQCRAELVSRGFTFEWIVPDIGEPITPPFSGLEA